MPKSLPPHARTTPRNVQAAQAIPSGGQAVEHERDELTRLIVSRFPVIYVDTREEERAEQLVMQAARSVARRCWTWSLSTGVIPAGENRTDPATAEPVPAMRRIEAQSDDSIFVLRDGARHIESDPVVERMVRDIARGSSSVSVIVLGPHGPIPQSLIGAVAQYELPRPGLARIEQHVHEVIRHAQSTRGVRNSLDFNGLRRLVGALRGLTLEEIDQVLMSVLYDDHAITLEDIPRAIAEKGRLLATSGPVSLETPTQGLEWVAGFENVKSWVSSRGAAFSVEAQSFGLEPPRGLVLTGVPGCGKSFVSKAIAHDWHLPLLRLDAGALFDSYIGASERNLREALKTAESLAPCVLWIDEIEKGFASSGPSSSDGGLAYRMLGTLVTWMQERPAPVVLLATSNDTTKLPPELLRQGRFDEVFFVDLPSAAAREHMFALQFARRGRDYRTFDCASLADATDGFSGSEIEQSVTNALYAAFAAGRELTTEDVAGEITATRPLSITRPDAIAQIRDWGAAHARPA